MDSGGSVLRTSSDAVPGVSWRYDCVVVAVLRRSVFDRGHDADDRAPGLWGPIRRRSSLCEPDAPADRICARKELRRKPLIHDDRFKARGTICACEIPSSNQGRPQHREEFRGDGDGADEHRCGSGGLSRKVDFEQSFAPVVRRYAVSDRRRFDAGDCPEPRLEPIEEGAPGYSRP
jgi:hypothetical protein